MTIPRKRIAAIAALIVMSAAFAGCSGDSKAQVNEVQSGAVAPEGATDSYTYTGKNGDEPATAAGAAPDAPADSAAKAAGEAALSPGSLLAVPGEQLMIVTGSISLTVKDPLAAADKIAQAAFAAGGRVDSRSESGTGDEARASLTIRIPGDKTNATIESIKKMGEADVQVGQEDVTTQAIDLDQRIAALQASVGRMEQLITQATKVGDILAIESKLTERQSELRSLKAQRDSLSDKVALSTIDVSISPVPVEVKPERTGPWKSLLEGWDALLTFLSGVVNALALALPFLAFFALLAAVIYVAFRAWRRGHPRRPAGPVPSLPKAGPGEMTGKTD